MRDSSLDYYLKNMGKTVRRKAPTKRIRKAFDRDALKRVCEMHEDEFYEAYDMELVSVQQSFPDDYYCFLDRGSDILAVAHLDTVVADNRRQAQFLTLASGEEIVYSGALDDRLGAYTILELLPALGYNFDVLLTVGEESGRSTAQFFDPPKGKDYKWGIEFDRGGTDVVMYQYEDRATTELVRQSGARVGNGSFSDIAYLEHVGAKMFNWGIGYRDYHGPRGHAYLDDTFQMVAYFLNFHEDNKDSFLPHTPERSSWWGYGRGSGSIWDDEVVESLTEEEILDALCDSNLSEEMRQQMEEVLLARDEEGEEVDETCVNCGYRLSGLLHNPDSGECLYPNADKGEPLVGFLTLDDHDPDQPKALVAPSGETMIGGNILGVSGVDPFPEEGVVEDLNDVVTDDPVEVAAILNRLDESGIQ